MFFPQHNSRAQKFTYALREFMGLPEIQLWILALKTLI